VTGRDLGALVLAVLLAIAAALAWATWDPCSAAPDQAVCERGLIP